MITFAQSGYLRQWQPVEPRKSGRFLIERTAINHHHPARHSFLIIEGF